jgi:hypothetical protein
VTDIRETLLLALEKHKAGQLDQAEKLYQQILRACPNHADALHLLGVLISQRGDNDLAISYIERALIAQPQTAAFHNNLGFSYMAVGRLEDAIGHFKEAMRLQPHFAMAVNNLGKTYREQGKLTEAMACYEQALAWQQDYVEAHFNRADLRLLMGDFEQGWPEYEWRWELPIVGRRATDPPRWNGSPLEGRTIVIHAEQGLGDTIQFIRYMPFLKQRGAKVIVHCQGALLKLLANVKGVDGFAAWHSPLPPFDVQEHLLDLPSVLHTTLATIPNDIPYLHADAGLVNHWRRETRTPDDSTPHYALRTPHFLIGIAWKGFVKNQSDSKRSIPLSCFEILTKVPGVQLISLQKGSGTEQLQGVDRILAPKLDEESGAFMDTAAVMMNLDLVISCDTVIPHLAGALGVPVWVALPLSHDWRWLLEREDSPWYPTLRLFRQTALGQWDDVFERMAEELTSEVGSQGPEERGEGRTTRTDQTGVPSAE